MPYKDIEKRRAYFRNYTKAVRTGRIIPKPGGHGRKGDMLKCAKCNKEFYRPPANRTNRGNAQYCSRSCMAAAFVGRQSCRKGIWITKPCSYCGKELNRPAWEHRQTEHPFCDSRCFGKWKAINWRGSNNPCWRGGKPYDYGKNWTRQARRARARDGKICQFCRDSSLLRRNLDVHHIRPFRFFGLSNYKQANMLNNLVSLCPVCHCFLEKISRNGDIVDWITLLTLGVARLQQRPRTGRLAVALAIHQPPV